MAVISLSFYKVLSLPNVAQPNSIYFVQNGNNAETYITDSAGVLKNVGNTTMIQGLTQNINAGFFT
jgi:hypothetical protein